MILIKENKFFLYILIGVILIIFISGLFFIYQYKKISKEAVDIKFLNEILDKAKDINSIKYQFLIYSDGKLILKYNIWRKGENNKEKLKIEKEPLQDENKIIELWNAAEDLLLYFEPEKNIAKGKNIDELYTEGTKESLFRELANIKKEKPVILGREILDGKECIIIKNLSKEGELTRWVWIEYGLPIKTISGDSTVEFRSKNIEVNIEIPDDIFELPTGVQIVPFN